MKWGQIASAGMGGVAGQIASLVSLPIISRIYTQADIGLWAVWLSAATIIGSVGYLRYELAIVVVRDDEEARDLACLCGVVLFGVVSLAWLFCMVPDVRGFFGQEGVDAFWIALAAPLMSLGIGVMQIMQSWCVRREWYAVQSCSQAAVAMIVPIAQIGGGWMNGGTEWLVGGSLAGQWLSTAAMLTYIQRSHSRLFRMPSSVSSLINAARIHKLFALYSAPYTLFGVLRDRASLFVLQANVSAAQVGQYAYVWRCLNFPVSLISGAIRPVLFKDGAAWGVNRIAGDVQKILIVIALAGTPWAVLFFMMPNEWLTIALGSAWAPAGGIGAWVIWIAFSYLFCNWLDRVMDVLQKQRLTLAMEMIFSTLALAGMALAFHSGAGLRGALAAQTIILVTYNIVYLCVAFRCAGYGIRMVGQVMGLVLITGLVSIAIWLLCRWVYPPWTSAAIYIGVYTITAVLVGWRLLAHWCK